MNHYFKRFYINQISEIFFCIICIVLISCHSDSPGQKYTHIGFETNDPSQIINDECLSYTLFISTSHSYSDDTGKNYTNKKAIKLGEIFERFSESIGKNNCAIWCGQKISGNYSLNVELGKYYADKFRLSYNNGPFVILTKINPTIKNSMINERSLVLSFSNVNSNRIITVLNELERKIRTRQPSDAELQLALYKEIIFSQFENHEDFVKEVLGILLVKK